jgi:2-polyprenyl-3-methyl-5-hydroxy-6-metoxy-1,4-benzoquinol methylase
LSLRKQLTPAAAAALALYGSAPASVRMHLRLRWRSCPLDAVADRVPTRGRVLDLGCGHGLLAAYLALGSRERSVLGVDLDDRKLPHGRVAAERARAEGAALEFEVAPGGVVPAGPWDAIVVVDVLYLLGEREQCELLVAAAGQLAAGGALLVKEMATEPRWKYRWNQLQETVSVRVLGITATERRDFCFVSPATIRGWLEPVGLTVEETPLHRGYVHPHHLVVASRPA